ncbi:hypothetical protein DCC81_12145 [Chitinophaga parva]|uniref:Uncharacterized protein n=1 Tax=Chitinophaga parva TaxID=2169414 RepID=A0A2T7BFJ6_9BACT|nr:hypothetical protein [Chitinophaga parva]PUZ25057.1 hypothetical protein DCC81_12145 [Chitinophaga parva]
MDLKKETEELLNILKSQGFDRSQIEQELAYSDNYIAQQLSKGGNPKLLAKLKKLVASRNMKAAEGYVVVDVGAALRRIEARQEVSLSAIAEILAHQRNLPTVSVLGELEAAINKRLSV